MTGMTMVLNFVKSILDLFALLFGKRRGLLVFMVVFMLAMIVPSTRSLVIEQWEKVWGADEGAKPVDFDNRKVLATLQSLGYSVGATSDKWEQPAIKAWRSFQKDFGLAESDSVNAVSLARLDEAARSARERWSGEEVREVQQKLSQLGFAPGPVDGVLGPATRWALQRWQLSEDLAQTGCLNVASWRKLQAIRVIPLPPADSREASQQTTPGSPPQSPSGTAPAQSQVSGPSTVRLSTAEQAFERGDWEHNPEGAKVFGETFVDAYLLPFVPWTSRAFPVPDVTPEMGFLLNGKYARFEYHF